MTLSSPHLAVKAIAILPGCKAKNLWKQNFEDCSIIKTKQILEKQNQLLFKLVLISKFLSQSLDFN